MPEPSHGFTLKEAAAELGIAEKTLRGWIRKGKAEANGRTLSWRMVDGPRGPEYRVWLDADPMDIPTSTPAVTLASPSTLPDLDRFAEHVADLVQARLNGTLPSTLADTVSSMERAMQNQTNGLASGLESVLRCMQEQAAEIAALRAELAEARKPWWRRRKK